jgi:O-antigen/teichoic acid export membrane protein
MFGIMAMATMVMVGLSLLSDIGLKPSVVQNERGDEARFLNTAWVIQIARGVALWFAAIILSLLLAQARIAGVLPANTVYADPVLPFVIAVLSFSTVIAGFESTKSLQASRSLQLAAITRIDVTSQIVGFVTMVAWALFERTIWALVVSALFAGVTRTVLTHVWLKGVRNRIYWDRTAYVEIVKFGKWLLLSSVLFFLASSGDRLMLGAMVGADVLGAYAVAFLIFSSIDQLISKIIVDVSFPALSEIVRENRAGLAAAYYKFHLAVGGVAFFSAGALMVSGQSIIHVLYDSRYMQAGWILQVLAVAMLTFPFRILTQLFLALGMAKTFFQFNVVRIVTLFVGIALGFKLWGLQGAVWGIVVSYFSSIPLILIYAVPLRILNYKRELAVVPFFAGGLAVGELIRQVALLIKS